MITFEESAALPGKETFGGVQKVFVLKWTLSGDQSKSIWISNGFGTKKCLYFQWFDWFPESVRFKFKRFLIPVQKVYEIPMILKQEKSLGVMGFAWFSENTWIWKAAF